MRSLPDLACDQCRGKGRVFDARASAVSIVDLSHGFTMEFAPSPAQHECEYDEMEQSILDGDVKVSPEHHQTYPCPAPACDGGLLALDVWLTRVAAVLASIDLPAQVRHLKAWGVTP